tara:strand:- start:1141 stop:1599 length:459 start_codon:yes stop_codon:yes gene_type:complete
MSTLNGQDFVQSTSKMTEAAVLVLLQVAVTKAEELGIRATVAVSDASGGLLGFVKMTDSFLVSSELARKKACSAAGMGIDTVELEALLASGPPRVLSGLTASADFTVMGGGVPLFANGDLIGGIGVSGGSEEQDIDCARTAALATQLARESK